MATFKKLPSGKWQAQVAKAGMRRSASFPTKRQAQDWAARQEYLALSPPDEKPPTTFAQVLLRYRDEETPKKRGARWESLRIERMLREDAALCGMRVADISAPDIAAFRDRRAQDVSPGTIIREMGLLSAIFNVARRDWGLISQSPMGGVRKPKAPAGRDRRVSDDEVARLIQAGGSDLSKVSARAVHAFRFAIETGMRAGEIVGLKETDIDKGKSVARLRMTKNGTGRVVPLSNAAIALIDALPASDGPIFGLTSGQVDSMFRKARDKAEIADLRFHDSRHEAITRMASKVDVLSLARIVGHKDIKMLMIYYNETPEALALRLN